VFWFWIFVGPALLLAALSLRGERKRAEYITSRLAGLDDPPARPLPPVTLIVPAHSRLETARALAAQDYPDYEIVADTAQARAQSQILAFGPTSGVVTKSWLRALVAPLLEEGVDTSTGFRCYVPEPPTFWSLMRSVWNSVIAGRLGPGDNEFAWRGALAHKTGAGSSRHIAFAPGAMVVDQTRPTLVQFLRQACGEMAQARRDYPRLWRQALIAHFIYCGAMLAASIVSAQGHHGAEMALVAQFGLGMLKGANRATLAKAELPAQQIWFDRYSWTHILWIPLVTWIWLGVLVASAFERAGFRDDALMKVARGSER
jgi:hypothetical protein